MDWYQQFHGDSWQKICDVLLSLKHKPDYQPISDKGGDLGIDGLVLSEALAYQAYGQEPGNTSPADGVRKKIGNDLLKLKKYQKKLQAQLGKYHLSRWILLLNKEIPHNDLHRYANSKQDEVLSWKLPFINDDFQVLLKPPAYLEPEWLEYVKKKDGRTEVDIPTRQVRALKNLRENEKFQAVFSKFKKITTESSAEIFAYDEICNYFRYGIQLEKIQKQEPELYDAIESSRSEAEEDAKQGSILTGTGESFTAAKQILESRLTNSLGTRLGPNTLGRVRKFIIADWFVRCPLDFKKKGVPDA